VDEDIFNLELRKFLKRFGVTAQREIEKAVEAALQQGGLSGEEVLPVRATLTIPGVLSEFHIDGEIALSPSGSAGRRQQSE
jgi:translation elongation factor EF-G